MVFSTIGSSLFVLALQMIRHPGETAVIERVYEGWRMSVGACIVGFVMLARHRRFHWPKDRVEWSGWALIACWILLIFLPRLV